MAQWRPFYVAFTGKGLAVCSECVFWLFQCYAHQSTRSRLIHGAENAMPPNPYEK
jgi:hypothetical protein